MQPITFYSLAMPSSKHLRGKRLLALLATEIERLLWRKKDIELEISKSKCLFHNDCNEHQLTATAQIAQEIQYLRKIPPPQSIAIQVVELNGMSHRIVVQPLFIQSLDISSPNLSSASQKTPKTKAATIADIKDAIEQVTGIPALSQDLYLQSSEDLETAVELCSQTMLCNEYRVVECGIQNNAIVQIVVNTDHYYWHRHSLLVQQYRAPLTRSFTLLWSQRHTIRTKRRRRLLRFLSLLRQALVFLSERKYSHSVRSLEHISRVEKLLVQAIFPLLDKIHSVFEPFRQAV